MRRFSDLGQAVAATIGVVASANVLVVNRLVQLPTDLGPPSAQEAAIASLDDWQVAATLGEFARVVAVTALLVAATAFCFRSRAGYPEGARRWAPVAAVASLAVWAAVVVLAATVQGALLRLSNGELPDLALAFGLAEYATALALVPLAAGAGCLAVAAGWIAWNHHGGVAAGARMVRAAAALLGVVAGAVAVASAPRIPVEGFSYDGNPFQPGSPWHAAVTVVWALLLAALAADGWRRREEPPPLPPASAA